MTIADAEGDAAGVAAAEGDADATALGLGAGAALAAAVDGAGATGGPNDQMGALALVQAAVPTRAMRAMMLTPRVRIRLPMLHLPFLGGPQPQRRRPARAAGRCAGSGDCSRSAPCRSAGIAADRVRRIRLWR
jgi:hypothetical protein